MNAAAKLIFLALNYIFRFHFFSYIRSCSQVFESNFCKLPHILLIIKIDEHSNLAVQFQVVLLIIHTIDMNNEHSEKGCIDRGEGGV